MKQKHHLTKTDYIHYLQCPKSLWLLKHRPEVYPHREFSDFLKKITREGYEVEEYAQRLFDGGVTVAGSAGDGGVTVAAGSNAGDGTAEDGTAGAGPNAEEKTRQLLAAGTPVLFQATVRTDDGMLIRTDVLEQNGDGTHNLYEVKSSTRIKKDKKHNHLKDACFQVIALEKAGLPVRDVYIVHVNGEYVFEGSVIPDEFLRRVPVTDGVRRMESETRAEVDAALSLLAAESVDENGCGCYRKTRTNHCDAFAYFNRVPEECSVWELCGIREKKLSALQDCGVEHLCDVPDHIELNTMQTLQVRSAKSGEPVIRHADIAAALGGLVFPLYFLDYETAMNAVPRIVGTRPWQQIPFQYSLHIMQKDGSVRHTEYLSDSLRDAERVCAALCENIGATGSVVSWHASFEKTRNKEMGEMFPRYRDALAAINERMVDLEDIFKESYVDTAFRGSTSIKKVLPVLCPHLSYADLAVRDGTHAMERWMAAVDGGMDAAELEKTRADLLEYCKLDTYAMVELYRKLCETART